LWASGKLKSRRGSFIGPSSTSFFQAWKRCITMERNFRSPWKGLRPTSRSCRRKTLESRFHNVRWIALLSGSPRVVRRNENGSYGGSSIHWRPM
jgi:hypothetical protein